MGTARVAVIKASWVWHVTSAQILLSMVKTVTRVSPVAFELLSKYLQTESERDFFSLSPLSLTSTAQTCLRHQIRI